ncbi:YqcI/YcgG family-domain-containing protein [Gymnopilus junonius]|uniref:YqcI/YcgG family-domain-containing protein n=1 Tax=Gymnopilus junonius TaxID=109634 RepID=A0A9P5NIK8_GYMJU|nr:YqcI/YcgG family-domain-containing protein [Gymnopilus junonius]
METLLINVSSYLFSGLLLSLLALVTIDRMPVVLKELTSRAKEMKITITRNLLTRNATPTKPLTRVQVTELFPEGTWQRTAYEDYVRVLLDEELVFPCIYATKGFKSDDQVYVFIDSDDLSDPRHIRALADGLADYLPKARSLGPNTSLVLLAKQNPNPRTVEEYQSLFWKLLDGCAKIDRKPWPADIPRTIDDAKWCFCFGGEPFFTVIQTPAHIQRRTRYAKGVTIVFQPKWIFNILFSTDAKRTAALAKVRSLLAKYDPIPVSPDLKNYGEPDSREFEQYFLMDENVSATTPYVKLSDSVELGVQS